MHSVILLQRKGRAVKALPLFLFLGSPTEDAVHRYTKSLIGKRHYEYVGGAELRVFGAIIDFFRGIWDAQKASLAEPLKKMETQQETALMLVALGELLGYPFQSTYYSRLLLVHWLPQVPQWRRQLLTEHDTLAKLSH